MKDYELGRLAEELIESRYGAKLKERDDKIAKLEEQVRILENDRIYCFNQMNRSCGNPFAKDTLIYRSFDEITKELKEADYKFKEKENQYKLLCNEYTKLDKFIHRNKRSVNKFIKWLQKGDKNGSRH